MLVYGTKPVTLNCLIINTWNNIKEPKWLNETSRHGSQRNRQLHLKQGDRRSLHLISSQLFRRWSCGVQAEQNLLPHLQKSGGAVNIEALKDLDETQGDEGVGPGGTRTQGDEGVGPGGTRTLGAGQLQSSPKSCSDDHCSSSATSGSAGASGAPPGSRDNTPDHAQASDFDDILCEIQELQENQGRLEEYFQNLKSYHHQEYTAIVEAIEEERYRCECLEGQLSDLTELHQNEILNLKEELASMEEEIAYPSFKRSTDVHEALQACETRLFKMELQQQQQVVHLEGLENVTAQPLFGKLINVLLAVMAVLLVFVSTVANCVVPLIKTCSRTLSTLLFVLIFCFLWRHWDAILEYRHSFFCSQHAEKGDVQ